jgi:filamentous hemagglutinin
LQAAGHYLRQDQIRSSQLFQGVVDENGNILTNTSGSSGGVNGDGIKIGGNRVDVRQLCGVSGVCTDFKIDPAGPSEWYSPSDSRVHLQPGISLSSVIASSPGLVPSPLGGLQGGLASINGIPYARGSFLDNLVESFAGPHDFLNAVHYYDELGNNIQNGASDVWNVVDLLPAMPVGLATLASQYPDIWQAMVNGYDAGRNDEKY